MSADTNVPDTDAIAARLREYLRDTAHINPLEKTTAISIGELRALLDEREAVRLIPAVENEAKVASSRMGHLGRGAWMDGRNSRAPHGANCLLAATTGGTSALHALRQDTTPRCHAVSVNNLDSVRCKQPYVVVVRLAVIASDAVDAERTVARLIDDGSSAFVDGDLITAWTVERIYPVLDALEEAVPKAEQEPKE